MGEWFGGKFVRYSNNTCITIYPLFTSQQFISSFITTNFLIDFNKIAYERRKL
jgi:hypothetical protein